MTPKEYVAAAMETMPPSLHMDGFTSGQMFAALMATSKAGNDIDPLKKALVYGRPIPPDSPYYKAKKVNDPKGIVPEGVIHGLIGMISESGELADLLLTSWFGADTPLDTVNLREELGDFLWYMARVLDTMQKLFPDEDWSFEAIMSGNIGKLRLRHDPGNKGGVSFNPDAHNHANRDKDAERAAIEQAGAAGTNDGLNEQVGRLAAFILEHVPGEPSQSEGAVDTAIRLLTQHIDRVGEIDNATAVATQDDTAHAGSYFRGMANGLILAQAILRGETPVYIEALPAESEPAPVADDGVHKQSSPGLSALASGVLHRTAGNAPWLEEGFDTPRLVKDARRLAGSVLGQDETPGQG